MTNAPQSASSHPLNEVSQIGTRGNGRSGRYWPVMADLAKLCR